jgi:hypothetical protein
MDNTFSQALHSLNWFRIIARALALCWATLWGLFIGINVVSGFTGQAGSQAMQGLFYGTVGLLLVAIPTVTAWRSPRVGGIALTALGLITGTVYLIWPPPQMAGRDVISTAFLIGGPPLIAGLCFLFSLRRT